ncbi:hypothetical protein SAMN03159358_2645 [Paenibacillus sp. NFR01]|nr:hypothetical protein SAMN03159358_2645 [Paenibacillus sp. NFR01]
MAMKKPARAKKKQAYPKRLRQPVLRARPKRSSRTSVNAQTVRFAVIGDSHVGYGNSQAIFAGLLPKAASGGNKRFFIFGGDNAQAGADHGSHADAYYQAFKDQVTQTLGSIPYRTSIGNWEASTRPLFVKHLNPVYGQMNFPGTQGKVKYIWLDCALGAFSSGSLRLLRNLDDKSFYVIDFHWPLNVPGITVDPSHVLSKTETEKFYNAIPFAARSKVLAIFTHHGHKFFRKLGNLYSGYAKTKFFVCGCSGDYKCKSGDRGYYDGVLTINGNTASLEAYRVQVT